MLRIKRPLGQNWKSRRRGFSLVEVLMGIVMIGLCATLLVATMPTANRNREKANLQNKAMSLAQKQLEAIRGLGYANATPQQLAVNGLLDSANPVSTNTYSFTNVDNSEFDNPSTVLQSGEGLVTIEQVDLDLRRIVIEVRWNDRGQVRNVRVGGLLANL